MNFLLPLLGLVAAGGFGTYFIGRYSQHRKERQVILGRDPLPIAALYDQVSPGADVPVQEFESTWLKVASLLETPAEKLRPSDRFDREFAPSKNSPDDRLLQLGHYLNVAVPDADVKSLEDVGSLVRYLLSHHAV